MIKIIKRSLLLALVITSVLASGAFAAGVLTYDQNSKFLIQDRVRILNPQTFDLQLKAISNNYNGPLFFNMARDLQLRIDKDNNFANNSFFVKSKKNGVQTDLLSLTEAGVIKVGTNQADPIFSINPSGNILIKGSLSFSSADGLKLNDGQINHDAESVLEIKNSNNLNFISPTVLNEFTIFSKAFSVIGSVNADITALSGAALIVNDKINIKEDSIESPGKLTLSASGTLGQIILQNGLADKIIFDGITTGNNGSDINLGTKPFGGMYTLTHCLSPSPWYNTTSAATAGKMNVSDAYEDCGFTSPAKYNDPCLHGNPYADSSTISPFIRPAADYKYDSDTPSHYCGCPSFAPNPHFLRGTPKYVHVNPAGSGNGDDTDMVYSYTRVYWCSKNP